MAQELIPFGKLKGKPLEELAKHKDYAEWLTSQPDFKRKYPDIYMFIINHFRKPDDTPEHNELQVKFLDNSFSLKLAKLLEANLFDGTTLPELTKPIFEVGYDVSFMASAGHRRLYIRILIEIKPIIGDDFPSVLRQMKASMPIREDVHVSKTFYCLLVRQYNGEGASKDQFIQFFQSQGYTVVFFDDIENTKL